MCYYFVQEALLSLDSLPCFDDPINGTTSSLDSR